MFQDADGDHVFNDKSLKLRLSDILMDGFGRVPAPVASLPSAQLLSPIGQGLARRRLTIDTSSARFHVVSYKG
jgi:hypothetical protein